MTHVAVILSGVAANVGVFVYGRFPTKSLPPLADFFWLVLPAPEIERQRLLTALVALLPTEEVTQMVEKLAEETAVNTTSH
ncbi:MAG: hypothetical protein IAE79_06155 [Anaerolinea sp.]|nr:hypothetical protein [Anaerolinea sp.]